jgi:hypothetical protein
MAISRTQLIGKVRRRLGEPMVKVELHDEQIIDHINYARQKWIKWATSNSTQDVYFTVLLQAGKKFYDLPAGVTDVIAYDDEPIQSGGINTLFTIDNFMFSRGFYGNVFWGGYDLVSYHLVQDWLHTLRKYRTTPYNWRYHKSTNQLEISPTPMSSSNDIDVDVINPNTGLVETVAVDSPGWVMLRAYTIQGATLPNYTPAWGDVLRERKTIVEDIELTQADIDNKYITLSHTPIINDTQDTNIIEDTSVVLGGLSRQKGVDWNFYIDNPRVIVWEGLSWDGVVSAGEVIQVKYPVVFKSQLYQDEDWAAVTETRLETEQFVITSDDLVKGEIQVQFPIWADNVRVSIGQIDHFLGEDYVIDTENNCIIRWQGLGMESLLAEDDVISVSYVTAIGTAVASPCYTGQQTMQKQYVTKMEHRIMTQEDVDNGFMLIEGDTVAVGDGVKLSVGSLTRTYNIDYGIINDEVNNRFQIVFNGYALGGNMAKDDEVIITYTSAVPIVSELEEDLYDEDWIYDYVTALSKITLGLVRRKFANFNSLGNTGISMDGDSLVAEGGTEKEDLETRLREEEPHEGYGIEIGMF